MNALRETCILTVSKKLHQELPGNWKRDRRFQTVSSYVGVPSDMIGMLYGKYVFCLHCFKDIISAQNAVTIGLTKNSWENWKAHPGLLNNCTQTVFLRN